MVFAVASGGSDVSCSSDESMVLVVFAVVEKCEQVYLIPCLSTFTTSMHLSYGRVLCADKLVQRGSAKGRWKVE